MLGFSFCCERAVCRRSPVTSRCKCQVSLVSLVAVSLVLLRTPVALTRGLQTLLVTSKASAACLSWSEPVWLPDVQGREVASVAYSQGQSREEERHQRHRAEAAMSTALATRPPLFLAASLPGRGACALSAARDCLQLSSTLQTTFVYTHHNFSVKTLSLILEVYCQ